ncbi:GNAT family N-acetyltransferase [Teichococcus aestuarii]|uniref:GNAT family N-acetyltransferase n=1 Tax=Teichococcus aestuarii TaxID=568898 RepID=A0A2U1V6A0_9PROT|nr:GNAT family N-acetyltransferase [Pseudoroseomonas aestuarii]PWC29413.1 GNAT family N-acetyltransferase [Pseudoroseomonas aestuarii]
MSTTLAATLLRPATEADLPAITAIYGHHVRQGCASFETAPPDLPEMRRRFAAILAQGMPYLVAEQDGVVLGYAYAGPYRPRAAYRDTVENSIYVRADAAGRGLGRLLLGALLEACTARGARQMIAVVGDSDNIASIRLHEAMGFTLVGTLRSVGRKHGRWLDSVLLQRALGEGDATPPETEPA